MNIITIMDLNDEYDWNGNLILFLMNNNNNQ